MNFCLYWHHAGKAQPEREPEHSGREKEFISMHHDSSSRVSSKNQGFHGHQAWVHWEYSPEEWAAFDRVDWRTVWLRYWLLNLSPLDGFVILAVLCVVLFPANALGIVAGTIGFGITLLLPLLIVLFAVRRHSYLEAKKRH